MQQGALLLLLLFAEKFGASKNMNWNSFTMKGYDGGFITGCLKNNLLDIQSNTKKGFLIFTWVRQLIG